MKSRLLLLLAAFVAATSAAPAIADAELYRLLFPGTNCLGERMAGADDRTVERTIALDAYLAQEAEKSGVSPDDAFPGHRARESARVRRELYSALVFEPSFDPSEDAVRQLMEQAGSTTPRPELVTFNHLFRRIAPEMTEESIARERQLLLDAAQEVESGTPFSVVAARYNETQADWRGHVSNIAVEKTRGTLRDLLEELEPGEWSGVFGSPTGVNMIRIVARTPATESTPLVNRKDAERRLLRQALDTHIAAETRAWIQASGLTIDLAALLDDPVARSGEAVLRVGDTVVTAGDVLAFANIPDTHFETRSPGDTNWDAHIERIAEDLWLRSLPAGEEDGDLAKALRWIDHRVSGVALRQFMIESVSEADIDRELAENRESYAFSAEFRLERILVPVAQPGDPVSARAARLAGEEILARWSEGGNPEDIATERGFGFVREEEFTDRRKLYDRVEFVVIGMEEGELAGPIATSQGYEVLKVVERRKVLPPEPALRQRARRHLGKSRFESLARESSVAASE